MSAQMLREIGTGILETLYMTLGSSFLSYLLGLPLGIVLHLTGKEGLHPLPALHGTLNVIVNVLRSVPFLILLIAVLPVTRFITGTSLGSSATIVPLVIAATPFIARLVESSLGEVDRGVVEAAQSMGATTPQIVRRVLLGEALPSLLTGAAIAATTILGYSAMAGICGGGGLGAIAINYGLYRYQDDVMLLTVALLVLIVQLMQEIGMRIAKRNNRRL